MTTVSEIPLFMGSGHMNVPIQLSSKKFHWPAKSGQSKNEKASAANLTKLSREMRPESAGWTKKYIGRHTIGDRETYFKRFRKSINKNFSTTYGGNNSENSKMECAIIYSCSL